ncbi:DsbC family protein [Pseudomonas sp. 2FE]|uniref:DsbC family protein n=1 Tax=Pseudomonas sp. 2FE TaxID=2502190 RepID=UPI0010FA2BB8|nr:DsbC family protein [Pseudomonas sp. 2FE]
MLKSTRAIISLSLLALACNAFAQDIAQKNADKVVMLPAAGMLAIEKNGKFAIISDTGRFIIQGKVYDTWAQKELTTLEDARIAANYIPVDRANVGFKDLAPMTIGNGDKAVTMFSDPACGYCKEIIAEARSSLPDGYRLDVLMLPVLSKESAIRTKEMLCAEDKVAAWKAGVSGDMTTPLAQLPEGGCNIDIIMKRRTTAQFLGVRNVPFLIRNDGLTHMGKPAEGLRAWIETNRSK